MPWDCKENDKVINEDLGETFGCNILGNSFKYLKSISPQLWGRSI